MLRRGAVRTIQDAEQLQRDKLLGKNINTGLAISVVNGAATAVFLFPRSDPAVILTWLAVLLGTNFFRCVIARRVNVGNQVLSNDDFQWILVMTVISGLCWGFTPYMIMEQGARAEHFTIFMIAGMTAAACLSYATQYGDCRRL